MGMVATCSELKKMNDNSIFELQKIARDHNEKRAADRFREASKLSCNEKISKTQGVEIAPGVVESNGMVFVGDNAMSKFNGE